jgi:hypothetical protein
LNISLGFECRNFNNKVEQMKRRTVLKWASIAGFAQVSGVGGLSSQPQSTSPAHGKGPIVLYCDLAFDPADEEKMLEIFHHRFKPVAERFDGYIDLKMVKLRKVMRGGPAPPPGINYRFQLTYESEEKRQIWIASEVHSKNWPLIENLVLNRDYLVLLTDSV